MPKIMAVGEEGTTTVAVFVANHIFGLGNYKYRLSGVLDRTFHPFLKIAKKGAHRIGIIVGTEKHPIFFRNTCWIRYKKVS